MTARYDIAIVGSGFSGSLMAMIACRLGYSVALIDKGKHPRVVIGESSTPLTNLLLEEISVRYDLPVLKSLTKWGTWQRDYPGIACGLKRGFTFYHHDLASPISNLPDRSQQLLVAASPNDRLADTHWYRADFDHFLVNQGRQMGVNCLDETQLSSMVELDSGIVLEGKRGGREMSLFARFLIDASGPRGFVHRVLDLAERNFPTSPNTQSIYNHFSGVNRIASHSPDSGEQPPYPVDDAAVHHIFDGGWIWVLHFNNGLTSAGMAATDRLASSLNFSHSENAWGEVLRKIPMLNTQFETAKPEASFSHIPRLSFYSSKIAGSNWAMLPSAAGFIDPLLSTGFPLTLLGVGRLAEIIEGALEKRHLAPRLLAYGHKTEEELLATALLIGSLYHNMHDFPVFSALTLLYFAAASFSETVRRLDKPHLAESFLLHDHPLFGATSRSLMERSLAPRTTDQSARLVEQIHLAIEPFNLAGLGDSGRNNWYPVLAEDLIRSHAKVNASPAELSTLLQRCGFPDDNHSLSPASISRSQP
ncbi:NAD(P)/FAD-dependent oxidoreductase [Acidisarcina polymorpha]|uniref:NAD(P)/FAD-dependent oxidoreductase n=1 Tax=Acidisarcina polymorpha TaxID=2211140 RepID=UPI001374BC4F|nr:tryptophan 7-halogenase [Acidisarcina polymorpha]